LTQDFGPQIGNAKHRKSDSQVHGAEAVSSYRRNFVPSPAARRWRSVACSGAAEKAEIAVRIMIVIPNQSRPDFQKRLANIGSYSRAMTPDQVIAFVKKEQDRAGFDVVFDCR
jgi:hypothetical protein